MNEGPGGWRSVSLTVLLFGLIPLLNAEILTGSTSVDALLANPVLVLIILPLEVVTYAIPLAIIGDVAARFRFGLRTIFLSGLIYGIINEAVFAKTLVAPYWPGVQFGSFRFLGLNILWLPEILIFHAVISTTVTVLVIRSLWPERVSTSFLQRRHYIALGAVLAVAVVATNAVLVPFVAKNLGYAPPFDPLPYFLLLLLSLSVVFLMKKSLAQRSVLRLWAGSRSAAYALLGPGILILPNVASQVALASVGAWLAGAMIALSGLLFYGYFGTLDLDTELAKRKTFLVYSTFIVAVLLIGFGGRQPASDLVAFGGVAFELFLGWWAATAN